MVRKRKLEILLSRVPPHPRPRVELEQYPTPPHLAARMLWVAAAHRDLPAGVVVDLGAGTGRLGIGAALLGSPCVISIDVDADALRVALAAARELGVDAAVDAVCCDATRVTLSRQANCAIQNPPFGVHRRGADVEFLRAALRVAATVYSVHKAEAADYIIRRCWEEGVEAEVLFDEVVRLPPTMPHHRKREHRVRVVVVRCARER